jgi:hypothetical protein
MLYEDSQGLKLRGYVKYKAEIFPIHCYVVFIADIEKNRPTFWIKPFIFGKTKLGFFVGY